MKKRILSLLLAGSMMLLTACGGHTHSAAGSWSSDLENHWNSCECGEQMEIAAHTLEDGTCTVCGSQVATYEDGTALLVCYNEYGDVSRVLSYASDGTVDHEERVEYTYDDQGVMLGQKTYGNDVLIAEYAYAKDSSGEVYTCKEVYYYEDGAKDTNEYDENGNVLCSAAYDESGAVMYAYAYEYSPEAGWMREKAYEGDRLASEQEFLTDEEGNQITIRYIYYNEDGSYSVTEYDEFGNETLEGSYDASGNAESVLRYENEYDADGNRTLRRTYEGDRLTEEMEFLFGSDEDGRWSMSGKTTTYYEDGSKCVADSDPEGAWSSEITYDAAGNVIEEIRYEYVMDENGESTGSKGYQNGRLFQEVQSIVNEDGEATGMIWICYEEDGSKTVEEYNDSFELVKETSYDAAGNVVSESE